MNMILMSLEPYYWLDSRKIQTFKFFPSQTHTSSLCSPTTLLRYFQVVRNKYVWISTHDVSSLQVYRKRRKAQEVASVTKHPGLTQALECPQKLLVGPGETRVHCLLFESPCYSIYLSTFTCDHFLLSYFYILTSVYL